jgi:hypothetical protein
MLFYNKFAVVSAGVLIQLTRTKHGGISFVKALDFCLVQDTCSFARNQITAMTSVDLFPFISPGSMPAKLGPKYRKFTSDSSRVL